MRIKKTTKSTPKPWEVDLGRLAGKRLRKYFETKAQAEGYATAKKLERENLGTQALTLTDEERADYRAAKEKLKPLGVSLTESANHYIKTHKTTEKKTIAEAVAECLKAKSASGKRKSYQARLKSVLNTFKAARAETLCSEVTTKQIEDWLNGNGWSITTRRGYLIDVITLFQYAANQGYCSGNPATKVEMPEPEQKEPRPLKLAEIKTLLRAGMQLDAELISGYIAPILFGGLRTSECISIETDDIKADFIRVLPAKAKTRQRRDIEKTPRLKSWMKFCEEWPLKNVLGRLGKVKKGAKRLEPEFKWPPNCLRHSFCSYGVEAMGARWTSERAGHSEQMLYNRYRTVVSKKDAEEFWKLKPSDFMGPRQAESIHKQ